MVSGNRPSLQVLVEPAEHLLLGFARLEVVDVHSVLQHLAAREQWVPDVEEVSAFRESAVDEFFVVVNAHLVAGEARHVVLQVLLFLLLPEFIDDLPLRFAVRAAVPCLVVVNRVETDRSGLE